MTRMQVLHNYQVLRMADGDNMEAYLRKFKLAKRKVEEHSIKLEQIVHKSMLLASIPEGYRITAALIESDEKIDTDAAMNRLLEECRSSIIFSTNWSVSVTRSAAIH